MTPQGKLPWPSMERRYWYRTGAGTGTGHRYRSVGGAGGGEQKRLHGRCALGRVGGMVVLLVSPSRTLRTCGGARSVYLHGRGERIELLL